MAKPTLPALWVTRRTVSYRTNDPSTDPTDSGGGTGDSGAGTGVEDPTGAGGSGNDPEKKEPVEDSVPRSELDKLQERMRAADQRASKAEADLQKINDKDKSELELAQRKVQELEVEKAKLAESLREKALKTEILATTEFSWHDPEDVLLLAERAVRAEDLTIEDDGNVKGLKAWLAALAKSKPHLVKPKESEPDDGRSPSGGEFGGKGKNGKAADEAALRKKYPALR